MTTRRHQLRSRVESLLQKYPYVLEAVSAAVAGVSLASAAFGAGIALFGLAEAFLLSAVALPIGLILGWSLANLLLAFVFMVFVLVCPQAKSIIFVSAGIALAGTAAHWVFNGIGFPAAVLYFCMFYLLSAIVCDILISVWGAGRRTLLTERRRSAESD